MRDSNGKMITTKKINSDASRWVEENEGRYVVVYRRKERTKEGENEEEEKREELSEVEKRKLLTMRC